MSQDLALGNEELFGGEIGDDLELSDFEGDQGSADENDKPDSNGNEENHQSNEESTAHYEKEQPQQEQQQQTPGEALFSREDDNYDDEEEEEEDEEEAVMRRPRLPSFKRAQRDSTQEDDPDLERMREELRSKRQVAAGEDGGDSQHVSQQPPGELDPGQAFLEVFDRYSEKVMSSGKRKRKKADEEDLERAMDDELSSLRDKMKMAAEQDNHSNSQRKPALAKLKMLQEAKALLTLDAAQDSILDNNLLDTIRLWLEPLPDRSLPSLDIQNTMLDILNSLTISSGHLRESGVGKIVYFYQKSPRVEPRVKRKAEQLVAKWSRLVIKRSDNYRERMHEEQDYSREQSMAQRKRYRPSNEQPREGGDDPRRRVHVHIPQAVAPDYDIIPKSVVKKERRIKSKEGTMKRLTNTIRSMKK
ncbi:hypothetical protein BDB00DRAFT_278511 [Zychaea mexicana]|uniref:uncharacterized protein n=1 Tax=Zychaea mexicana TaxID=64656 RepID=UPI0022FE9AF0|nr:uncharacterized protein BDB00DRAFT_278511 [Zychaea mexicana]KAI9494922.1 hypothetical protein BDB00DRAFT_278511 [Zychaea mexicana]